MTSNRALTGKYSAVCLGALSGLDNDPRRDLDRALAYGVVLIVAVPAATIMSPTTMAEITNPTTAVTMAKVLAFREDA